MKILTCRLELLEPLLATSLAGDPNSETTCDYLPGSMLRGALIARYAAHINANPASINTTDPEFARLFLDGSTRYLNGYKVEGNVRSQPTAATP